MRQQVQVTKRAGRKKCSDLSRGASGFTLVEVLVAALIASFAIAAGMKVFVTQNQQQIIQHGVTNMQQNGRATIDELVSKVRQAGYKVPPTVSCLVGWNTNPDTIALVFLDEPACTATLSADMPQPSSELKCGGADLSCFQEDTWAYIYDPKADSGEFFYITNVQVSAEHLQHNTAKLSKKYPKGSQIFILDYRKYYIDTSTDSLRPTFMLAANGGDPIVYADNIVDLQFQYVMANGAVKDTVAVDRHVREVEIKVVARTEKSDLFLNDFRYDTLATSVMVRNLSL